MSAWPAIALPLGDPEQAGLRGPGHSLLSPGQSKRHAGCPGVRFAHMGSFLTVQQARTPPSTHRVNGNAPTYARPEFDPLCLLLASAIIKPPAAALHMQHFIPPLPHAPLMPNAALVPCILTLQLQTNLAL